MRQMYTTISERDVSTDTKAIIKVSLAESSNGNLIAQARKWYWDREANVNKPSKDGFALKADSDLLRSIATALMETANDLDDHVKVKNRSEL